MTAPGMAAVIRERRPKHFARRCVQGMHASARRSLVFVGTFRFFAGHVRNGNVERVAIQRHTEMNAALNSATADLAVPYEAAVLRAHRVNITTLLSGE